MGWYATSTQDGEDITDSSALIHEFYSTQTNMVSSLDHKMDGKGILSLSFCLVSVFFCLCFGSFGLLDFVL